MLGFSVEAGTLDWYAKALGEGLYLRVFWNTFEIALLVTAVLPAAGLSAGLPDRHHDAGLGDARLHLRAAAALDLGAGAHLCLDGAARPQRRVQPHADRLPASSAIPLPLLHNFTGVLIGMVHVLLPYMVLPIYGAVRRVDPRHRRRRGGAGRLELAHLLAHLPAAHAERHLRRLRAGLRAVARLLHHARRCWAAAGSS